MPVPEPTHDVIDTYGVCIHLENKDNVTKKLNAVKRLAWEILNNFCITTAAPTTQAVSDQRVIKKAWEGSGRQDFNLQNQVED